MHPNLSALTQRRDNKFNLKKRISMPLNNRFRNNLVNDENSHPNMDDQPLVSTASVYNSEAKRKDVLPRISQLMETPTV